MGFSELYPGTTQLFPHLADHSRLSFSFPMKQNTGVNTHLSLWPRRCSSDVHFPECEKGSAHLSLLLGEGWCSCVITCL